jgi:hypothetical protein
MSEGTDIITQQALGHTRNNRIVEAVVILRQIVPFLSAPYHSADI